MLLFGMVVGALIWHGLRCFFVKAALGSRKVAGQVRRCCSVLAPWRQNWLPAGMGCGKLFALRAH